MTILMMMMCCSLFFFSTQHDLLDEAKKRTYLKSFNDGIMLVGSQKGKYVKEAKEAMKKELIQSKEAIKYYEPESIIAILYNHHHCL